MQASMSDQEKYYEVESILGKRKKKGKLQYLVKWKGWDRPQDNSWRSLKDMQCQDLIEDFEAAAEAKIKPGDAGKPKRKKKNVDVRGSRRVPPGPKLKESVSLGFARGLTAEKIVGIAPHPADGELLHLVKVS